VVEDPVRWSLHRQNENIQQDLKKKKNIEFANGIQP